MAVKIDTDAEINSIRLKDQGSAPAAPASGYKSLFVTTNGLFIESSAGEVIGPFITGTFATGTSIQNIIIQQYIEFTPASAPGGGGGKGKQYATGNDLYYVNPSGTVYQITAPRMVAYNWNGVLFVSTGTSRLYNQLGNTYSFQEAFLSVGQAPTQSSIIADVKKNGTTVFNTKPSIPAGSVTGSSADFSVSTWSPGDYLTFDINQIGSGTAGSNMIAHIVIKQAS